MTIDKKIKFKIDGKICSAKNNQTILDAAEENGIYIPRLCHYKGADKPIGSCRLCTVKINGRYTASCVATPDENMEVENNTPELLNLRKSLLEMMFVEGNHFCPACEKSGDCELQAQAYRHQMVVPRFPYQFRDREVDFFPNQLVLEHNRCIMCLRCIHEVKSSDNKNIFGFINRGGASQIQIDPDHAKNMSDELADKAVNICPVGAILKKGKGFDRAVGTRKFDKEIIGSDVENPEK